MQRYLVTGAAEFIGASVAQALLEAGCEVVGVDDLNDYYDVGLKHYRLNPLLDHSRFSFVQGHLSDSQIVYLLFAQHDFDCVLHLAAQAGFGILSRIQGLISKAILSASSTSLTLAAQSLPGISCSPLPARPKVTATGNGSLRRTPAKRSQSVCGDQKMQRDGGPHLRPPPWSAIDRAPLLYSLRPCRAA